MTFDKKTYQRDYMARKRANLPPSRMKQMEQAFREILAILGDTEGAKGKQIKALAEQFTMEKG